MNTIESSRAPANQNQYIPNRQLQQKLTTEIIPNQIQSKSKLIDQMPQFGNNQHFTGSLFIRKRDEQTLSLVDVLIASTMPLNLTKRHLCIGK